MECDRYPANGQGVSTQAWACGVKRKLAGGVRLAGAGGGAALLARPRRSPPRRSPPRRSPRPSPRAPLPRVIPDAPFMNNIDEITFWIVTKRAPCLAGFEDPRRSTSRAPRSASPVPQSKKKKKRLVTDNTSDTTERPNYMNNAQPKFDPLSSGKSDTLISDVDFNIRNSSVQVKNKNRKNQRNSRKTLHKKNKVVTSTPNVTLNLRRSLRRAQCNLNNNSHLTGSFEISKLTNNGIDYPNESKCAQSRPSNLAGGDQSIKRNSTTFQKPSNGALNGQFEDLSDVSGFTANYIKSTKLNSKTPQKLRTKSNLNLAKESRQSGQKEGKSLIVSINKAVNTGNPMAAVFNCSTDSSQNIINLVTIEKESKTNKKHADKSTSLLKFIDCKTGSKKESRNGVLNVSFQSTSTTGSRYPKRHKPSTEVITMDNSEKTDPSKLSSDKKGTTTNNHSSKCSGQIGCSTENNVQPKTRSGRCLGRSKHPKNAVFVVNNSTEQVSSEVTMNVASPVQEEQRDNPKKKRLSTKCERRRKSLNKTGQSTRDSFREQSGFAACFSDSDDDKPLKPQKYLS